MNFTDEDLERLKNQTADYPWIDIGSDKMQALLARLEAAGAGHLENE